MNKPVKIAFLLILFMWVGNVSAESLEYVPLAPLPGISESGAGVSLETYLSAVFTFGLGIAVVLAVLVLVVAGVEYIGGAASESIKSDAKERIWHAILGLLLAFSSWIILNEINPNLLNVGLKFPASAVAPGGTTPPRPTTPGGGTRAGQPWPDDSINRTPLELAGVKFNNKNCKTVGESGCTSVFGLSSVVKNEILHLKYSCYSCYVEVTGGTEYWLHGDRKNESSTQHRPGGSVFDLHKDNSVDSYIINNGTLLPDGTPGCATGIKYSLNGNIYVDESGGAPHWHVCVR